VSIRDFFQKEILNVNVPKLLTGYIIVFIYLSIWVLQISI